MALELLPDGKTFKKLTGAQSGALERYYKRAREEPLSKSMILPSAMIAVAGIGALAYVFKDEIQKWFEEQQKDIAEWIKGLPVAAGGAVADTIVDSGGAILEAIEPGRGGPATLEFITINGREIGPLSVCQRWEYDAADWLALIQSKPDMGRIETVLAALTAKRIIKNMKALGCSKPAAFTTNQWKD